MKSCVAVGEHLATVRGAEQETPERPICCRFSGLRGGLEPRVCVCMCVCVCVCRGVDF